MQKPRNVMNQRPCHCRPISVSLASVFVLAIFVQCSEAIEASQMRSTTAVHKKGPETCTEYVNQEERRPARVCVQRLWQGKYSEKIKIELIETVQLVVTAIIFHQDIVNGFKSCQYNRSKCYVPRCAHTHTHTSRVFATVEIFWRILWINVPRHKASSRHIPRARIDNASWHLRMHCIASIQALFHCFIVVICNL